MESATIFCRHRSSFSMETELILEYATRRWSGGGMGSSGVRDEKKEPRVSRGLERLDGVRGSEVVIQGPGYLRKQGRRREGFWHRGHMQKRWTREVEGDLGGGGRSVVKRA